MGSVTADVLALMGSVAADVLALMGCVTADALVLLRLCGGCLAWLQLFVGAKSTAG